MKYSVVPILSTYINKQGLCAIQFQVIYGAIKVYPALDNKIQPKQWKNGQVVNHESKSLINRNLSRMKLDIETKLIALDGKQITAKELTALLSGKVKNTSSYSDFALTYIEEMKHKLSVGRLRHYKGVVKKVEKFRPDTKITDINGAWLQQFENWMIAQQFMTATIKHRIFIIKAIVRAAADRNIIERYDFKGYKNIKVVADEPEFLTEDELQSFFEVCRAIQKPNLKLSGYYFLLSCFTGLRISDAKRFNYKTHVTENEIVVRAQKNGKLVTIPIYKELIEVLEYIHDKPLNITEQNVRLHIRELADLAGIKKHVKFHTGRHTATTRFASKGLPQKYVADIIGDTEMVSKIYTHIDVKERNKKILTMLN